MSVFAQVLGDTDRYGHMNWDGGWMWIWGVVMMALLIVFIVWLVRTTTPGSGPRPHDQGERAREILAERFARGELSTEEYRERVNELR